VAIQCGDGLAGAVWMAASAYGLLALARCLLGTYRVRWGSLPLGLSWAGGWTRWAGRRWMGF